MSMNAYYMPPETRSDNKRPRQGAPTGGGGGLLPALGALVANKALGGGGSEMDPYQSQVPSSDGGPSISMDTGPFRGMSFGDTTIQDPQARSQSAPTSFLDTALKIAVPGLSIISGILGRNDAKKANQAARTPIDYDLFTKAGYTPQERQQMTRPLLDAVLRKINGYVTR